LNHTTTPYRTRITTLLPLVECRHHYRQERLLQTTPAHTVHHKIPTPAAPHGSTTDLCSGRDLHTTHSSASTYEVLPAQDLYSGRCYDAPVPPYSHRTFLDRLTTFEMPVRTFACSGRIFALFSHTTPGAPTHIHSSFHGFFYVTCLTFTTHLDRTIDDRLLLARFNTLCRFLGGVRTPYRPTPDFYATTACMVRTAFRSGQTGPDNTCCRAFVRCACLASFDKT